MIFSFHCGFLKVVMATEQVFPFSVASVVEDVLQQHGIHTRNIDLISKKAEEDCMFFVFLFSGHPRMR